MRTVPRSQGIRRWAWACVWLALLAVGLLPSLPAQAADAALAVRLDAILARLGPHAITALRVVSPTSGEVLYERNPDLSLTTASNMKLLTSATALARLGPEYRFTTQVRTLGVRDAGGILRGDLLLVGGGDPVLETGDLATLADAIKKAGIRQVAGSLIVDDHRYDDQRLGDSWNWDDEPYYYCAQIGALSVNRNVMTMRITPGKQPGMPAQISVEPLTDYVTVDAKVTTGERGSGTKLSMMRERARNVARLTGSVGVDAPQQRREVTCEAPDRYTGALFRRLLLERGIQITGVLRQAAAPAGGTVLAEHLSPELRKILPLLNKPSDNLIAEMLLKELAWVDSKGTAPGSAEKGAEVVLTWLKSKGVNTSGVRGGDGSGLGRRNLVTARALTMLLASVETEPWYEVFVSSLPVAGEDGTLRRRMRDTVAQGKLHAKTGSLNGVSSLSGYVETAGGERLVFSMLTNNFPGEEPGISPPKEVEDSVGVALAEFRRATP